ncbi:DUF4865 family protein [Streptosporangium sp. NPDC000509]|uniref:DUF4865 family protein n=1 Tax=Streptosporangium sp. NPDC000509 TaxID=3366186 RepID=UPI0036C047C4
MHAMQYEIGLPADYDMEIIRERVATRGHALDGYAGLGLKAYLVRERGVDGSTVNQYSPFYLWSSLTGMNDFLWGGGGFQNIVRDFGRPVIRHWIGAGYERGPSSETVPRAASRRTDPIPADTDPATAVERALAELRRYSGMAGVHSAALAVDPRHWELVRFTLWEHEVAADEEETPYRVLHLSTPHLGDIATGRHW